MKKYVLETERCLLREMNMEDAVHILKLNQHPYIYRFTTDPPFIDLKEAEAFIAGYNPYQKQGFGRWSVEIKSTRQYIGWCGLKYILRENEVDVGYRLLPEFWGQGYAVETGLKCCQLGLQVYGLNRIVARIHKENVRSIRVAEKMNMTYEKDLMYDGIPWLNYVKTK
jgi:RimJ/RimL family protein N-acetyltransferase